MDLVLGESTASDSMAVASLEPVTDFKSFDTSSGSVKVPMILRETVCIGVFFSVPIGKIRKFLPSSKLKPVVIGNGRTIYAIAAYEYLNIPFLPALFDQAFSVGFFLGHLPVTTKVALDSGVEIWGLPQILGDRKV